MGDPLSLCNFASIQGYSHPIPNKAIEKFPSFQGNNVVSSNTHVPNFNLCAMKWCNSHNYEDVKMTFFVYSLEGDVAEWFSEYDAEKFSTLVEITKALN
jgi:hypothetical protein